MLGGDALEVADAHRAARDPRGRVEQERRGQHGPRLAVLRARDAELQRPVGRAGRDARTAAARGRRRPRAAAAPSRACAFSSRALVVEQQRVLARRRREAALGDADDRDRGEAEVAHGVGVEQRDAAHAERAGARVEDVGGAQALERGDDRLAEALERQRVRQRVERRKPVERIDDRAGVGDVGRQQVAQPGEVLLPARALVAAAQPRVEVGDEGAQRVDARQALGQPRRRLFGVARDELGARRRRDALSHCSAPRTTPARRESVSHPAAETLP